MPIEQAHDRFVDNPGTGQQKQSGFDEGRKIFDFAMAILVVGVGGLVRDSDREIGQKSCDQIEGGVRGFGEDSEATCSDANDYLSSGDEDSGRNRVSSHCALLGAHRIRRIKGRRHGHDGIIAASA